MSNRPSEIKGFGQPISALESGKDLESQWESGSEKSLYTRM